MLVISLSANKKRLAILVALVVVLGAVTIGIMSRSTQASEDTAISYKASDEAQRLAFLSQFGWDVNPEPVSVEEVIIPVEFNDVYKKYNELQLSQGLDLTKYAGETAKKWTYQVKNFPGYTDETSVIQANLLVFNGTVIGGDISNAEQDGFMLTFDFPGEGEGSVE